VHQGRVVYGAIEEVVFGHPAAEAVVAQMDRLGTRRAFLMVSGTLNRQTDEIAKIKQALGARCAGLFDAMPAHTPREAVIAATNAAREAPIAEREAQSTRTAQEAVGPELHPQDMGDFVINRTRLAHDAAASGSALAAPTLRGERCWSSGTRCGGARKRKGRRALR